jgi:Zn-dependent peptidase ImmA (M78 family)
VNRVEVKTELLRWACERSGLDLTSLPKPLHGLPGWLSGETKPTLKQLETFARAARTPIGYLFLSEPPEEHLPIPDFRTMPAGRSRRPSPDLLDTLYLCQQRQEWYREFALSQDDEPLAFVGSAAITDDVVVTAGGIRGALGLDLERHRRASRWEDALRSFIELADDLGVLVMVSGVVGSNTHRKLDPQEFRGFALPDPLAPLVFVNGSDTKAAQMFTLAHELAHLWLGSSAVSDAQASSEPDNDVERWCNQVAAELLVPLTMFRADYDSRATLRAELDRLARVFKVSTLVILRRMHDVGGLTRDRFWQEYERESMRLRSIPRGSGGSFYYTQPARVSKRFARALIVSTLEGQASYRDAFRMLGCSKVASLHELGHRVGIL